MAVTVHELFDQFKLEYSGPIKWEEKFHAKYNGVYIISLNGNPECDIPHDRSLKIDESTFRSWLAEAKNLQIDGVKVTNMKQVQNYLEQYWKKDENILYIGESTSITNPLEKRIGQFYQHKVGKKGPHSGGYWLKLISNLKDVNIYYAECSNPREIEFKLIMRFVELFNDKSFFEVENFSSYFPFANLKVDVLKEHKITKPTNDNKREKIQL
jgi:hypothetical protein